MKKIVAFISGSIMLAFISLASFTLKEDDCKIMHSGTFIYGDPGFEVKVVIKGNKHTEYHDNGRYFIKSKLTWLSDCEYDMTMTDVTIPNFPYKVGDVMNVKIDKVDGDKIYYTSTVQGKSWQGKFIKIKD
ncbi:MAG: hypothetical protein ABUT20_24040 [Bacteroidota bacterium]